MFCVGWRAVGYGKAASAAAGSATATAATAQASASVRPHPPVFRPSCTWSTDTVMSAGTEAVDAACRWPGPRTSRRTRTDPPRPQRASSRRARRRRRSAGPRTQSPERRPASVPRSRRSRESSPPVLRLLVCPRQATALVRTVEIAGPTPPCVHGSASGRPRKIRGLAGVAPESGVHHRAGVRARAVARGHVVGPLRAARVERDPARPARSSTRGGGEARPHGHRARSRSACSSGSASRSRASPPDHWNIALSSA